MSRAWGKLLAHPGLIVISSVIFTSSWLALTYKDWEVNFTNDRDTITGFSWDLPVQL
jgi:hypothetical protein